MFTFLLVVHALIAASLVTVILLQRSEGGGLGMGSSGPSGLMTARGAADFLTRATGILAGAFVLMAFLLAALAATRGSGTIDTSLAGQAPAGPITAPQPGSPTGGIPMMGAPMPAAPDPLTAGAIAPAAGGPPSKPVAEPKPQPRGVPVERLRTIDTGKAAGGDSVGIRGVGSRSDRPATTDAPRATDTKAPAAIPTVSPPAPPAAPATGNTQQ